jgi:hypothetical protein
MGSICSLSFLALKIWDPYPEIALIFGDFLPYLSLKLLWYFYLNLSNSIFWPLLQSGKNAEHSQPL